LPSSRRKPDPRRQIFLKLSSQIEGQLRDAYAKKYDAGVLNQSSLADKLGVNRSAVHHRLLGRTNMTIETIADMVWGLDHDIEVKIFDPAESNKNHRTTPDALPHSPQPVQPPPAADTPLMRIASTTPASNTAAPQVLGTSQKADTIPQKSLDYRAQLAGSR
jgi:hypothetical protein